MRTTIYIFLEINFEFHASILSAFYWHFTKKVYLFCTTLMSMLEIIF